MLTAISDKIRGFIGSRDGDKLTLSRKRKITDEVDIGQSPAKRKRSETDTGLSVTSEPKFSLVDWISRTKSSFNDSYYFKVIKDSPRRLLNKVKGSQSAGVTTNTREGIVPQQYQQFIPSGQLAPQHHTSFMQFQPHYNQPSSPYRSQGMEKKENVSQVHSTPRSKYPQGYSFSKARLEVSPADSFQFSASKENFSFKAPQSKTQTPTVRYHGMASSPASSRVLNGSGQVTHKSVYDRVYSKSSIYRPPFLDKTRGRGKLAARESIRMDEKNRYAQLLQQFTTTQIAGTAFGSGQIKLPNIAADTSVFTSTILGSSLLAERPSVKDKRGLKSPNTSKVCESTSLNTSTISVPRIQVEPKKILQNNSVIDLTDKSYEEIKNYRAAQQLARSVQPHKPPQPTESLFHKRDTSEQIGVPLEELTPVINRQTKQRPASNIKARDLDEPEIVKVIIPPLPKSPAEQLLRKQIEDSRFLNEDWISEIKNKYSFDKRTKAREIQEEEVKCQYFKEKRDEWEGSLEEHLKKRLAIAEREPPVLEELFVEPPDIDNEFIPLTEEQEHSVDDALVPHPSGQVLSDAFRLQITRKDLATLAGLNWLNDEIINFYMNMIMERGKSENFPSVHAFNTFFYPKIVGSGHSGVKRWTKKIDIFAMDYILIPVHLGMHWCLAVIDMRKKEVRYYDSMGGTNNQCLNALKQYLEEESLDKKKTPFDTSHWKLINVKDIPQQMNGSDCGMFACKFAEYISRDALISFTQEHMVYFRRKMVLEILMKNLL